MNVHKKLAAFVLLCMTAHSAWSWGGEGHQIVADLAYAQLTPVARKQVDRLLALETGATLASISTWADKHRNPASASWHYVNFPRNSCTYVPERDCPDGRCVVAAIDRQADALEYAVTDEASLQALKYLVHLVADIHQPLHTGYLEDKGGNKYQLRVFMRGSNLHAFWDSGMIRLLDEDHSAIVQRLLAKHRSDVSRSWTASQVAQESCKIVGMPGFYPERRVGVDYIESFKPTLENRLGLAGARLAGLLNRIWR